MLRLADDDDDVLHTLHTHRAPYHVLRSLSHSFIHSSALHFIFDSIQLLFCLLLLLSFSFVGGKIYGKSERFIGFRAMGLLLFSLFFSLLLLSLFHSTIVIVHRVVFCLLKICCFFIIILIKLLDTFISSTFFLYLYTNYEREVLHLSPITCLKISNDKTKQNVHQIWWIRHQFIRFVIKHEQN